jgi:polyisoprenyl-phosphate glycosyltransferase
LDDVVPSKFEVYIKDLQMHLAQRYSDYEIVVIDQNTHNFPPLVKEHILKNISSIRWLNLSFQVTLDTALGAGIENAIGDSVVLLRPTVDPISVVSDMIAMSLVGHDVIIGTAISPQTLGYRVARMMSNQFLKYINYRIPKNATPVRCLSRKAINTVLRTGNLNQQFYVKVSDAGYTPKVYPYKLMHEAMLTKRTFFTGLSSSVQFMIFSSTIPLRWISLLGILGSVSAFIIAAFSIVVNFIKNDVTEGWSSMVFFSSFLFMLLFVILAFLGEYMARLLNELSSQKKYYISNEQTSSIILDADRPNVFS